MLEDDWVNNANGIIQDKTDRIVELSQKLDDYKQKVKETIDKICNRCSCYEACKEHCVLGEFKQNIEIE